MAEIVESYSTGGALDSFSSPADIKEETGGFKMSTELTIDQGVAKFVLNSGSTGYSCHGTFMAPGVGDTKLSFPESDGLLQLQPDTELQGTYGVNAFNVDSFFTQKGILTLFFVTQTGSKETVVAVFHAPQALDQTLKNLPNIESFGYCGWSAPGK